MSGTAILLGIFLAGILAAISGIPFWRARKSVRNSTRTPNDMLVAEFQAQLAELVKNVKELDFDFDTGKVTESDYAIQRKLLIGRGVSTLIGLDEAQQIDRELDYEIEGLVAAYRHSK